MYKVFVNDKPIIITSSLNKENNFPVYILKNIVIDELIYKLRNERIKGINLYTSDIEIGWKNFINNFKIVSAAGGLVTNSKKEILLIYRNNKWDLPKGRLEKGESIKTAAIREVEEECGIFELTILQKLITTYHLYYQNGNKIKKTHWFLMNSDYQEKLTPQIEEGITMVNFYQEKEVISKLKNSYGNIKLVYDTYKEV